LSIGVFFSTNIRRLSLLLTSIFLIIQSKLTAFDPQVRVLPIKGNIAQEINFSLTFLKNPPGFSLIGISSIPSLNAPELLF
jgi:hypothetical protein